MYIYFLYVWFYVQIIRRCLSRNETQCSFFEYRGYKIIYRRYASLFFVVAVDGDEENELAILEFIHSLVETMDRYFESVCELDVSTLNECLLIINFILLINVSHSSFLLSHLSLYLFIFFFQIMYHIEKAHYIVDEMVANGAIIETNKANILKPIMLMDKTATAEDSIFSGNLLRR